MFWVAALSIWKMAESGKFLLFNRIPGEDPVHGKVSCTECNTILRKTSIWKHYTSRHPDKRIRRDDTMKNRDLKSYDRNKPGAGRAATWQNTDVIISDDIQSPPPAVMKNENPKNARQCVRVNMTLQTAPVNRAADTEEIECPGGLNKTAKDMAKTWPRRYGPWPEHVIRTTIGHILNLQEDYDQSHIDEVITCNFPNMYPGSVQLFRAAITETARQVSYEAAAREFATEIDKNEEGAKSIQRKLFILQGGMRPMPAPTRSEGRRRQRKQPLYSGIEDIVSDSSAASVPTGQDLSSQADNTTEGQPLMEPEKEIVPPEVKKKKLKITRRMPVETSDPFYIRSKPSTLDDEKHSTPLYIVSEEEECNDEFNIKVIQGAESNTDKSEIISESFSRQGIEECNQDLVIPESPEVQIQITQQTNADVAAEQEMNEKHADEKQQLLNKISASRRRTSKED